jgi:hypothetical protein
MVEINVLIVATILFVLGGCALVIAVRGVPAFVVQLVFCRHMLRRAGYLIGRHQ